jgi:PPM family protein phosphatase
VRIDMYGASDVGRVRKNNQDAFYCNATQGIAVVADGIGGRKGGEVASRMAVDGMRKAFLACDSLRHDEIANFLASTVDQINQDIIYAGEQRGLSGMGTTMECVMFVGDKIHIAHVGDSRTLLVYKSQLWQLTIDHNLKNFIDRGWIVRSEIGPKMREEALVKSLGLAPRCEIDIYNKQIREGELYVTCSDGLTSMVDHRKIAQLVTENVHQPEVIPELLIAKANQAGGRDNTTVVVTRIRAAE